MNLTEHKLDNRTVITIKNMYAKGATEDEFVVFITLCQKYDLDPMLNEIYFIKYGSAKPIMMTSRDGYLKIANRDNNFDGMVADVVYDGDELKRYSDGGVMITYGENHLKFDTSKITGAFCNVYRKDRKMCSSVTVSFKDYFKPNEMWKKNPNAMILKVAEAMALKRAFSINGLITNEEIGDSKNTHHDQNEATILVHDDSGVDEYISPEQYEKLYSKISTTSDPHKLMNAIKNKYLISRLREIKKEQFDEIITLIEMEDKI